MNICHFPVSRALVGCILAISLIIPDSVWAIELSVSAHGRARFRHTDLSNFSLDAKGVQHEQEKWGHTLIRVYPEVRVGEQFLIRGDLQMLNGQLYGEESVHGETVVLNPWKNKDGSEQFEVREAYVQASVGIGLLRVGRMVSHWGLGILANGGDKENYLFSDASHGDISNRAIFFTKPAKAFDDGRLGEALTFAIGADLVERDELTDRSEGDEARQFVGALLWKESDLEFGFYTANRNLEKSNGDVTKATAFDLFGRWEGDLSEDYSLKMSFEGAYIIGTTEQARFEGAQYPLDIRQFGGVLKTDAIHRGLQLGTGLELGFVSGDNSPQDGTARAMKLDPGYKVGMILFEEVLSRMTARSHDRVVDPDLVGTPPKGTDLIPTNGSITNALYVHPHVKYSPWGERLQMQLGYLWAMAPADVVDPFSAAENGGYNQNAFGVNNANGTLGSELNASLRSSLDLDGYFSIGFGVQYGMFKPGAALEAEEGVNGLGTIHKVRFLSDLSW